MSQWNANRTAVFALSMIAGLIQSAKAQDAVATETIGSNVETVEMVAPAALTTTMPVAMAPAMAPVAVPVNVSPVTSAPATAVADQGNGEAVTQSSNSNAGSGAMVIINNSQDQKATQEADQNAQLASGRADALRRERIRRELLNEGRLLEKIEENRIDSENRRTGAIEGIALGGEVETVQVAAVEAGGVTATAAAATYVSTSGGGIGHDPNNFRLSPIAGYRWLVGPDTYMGVQNMGVYGFSADTRLASYVSVEGNFMWSRDRFLAPGMYGPGQTGGMPMGPGPGMAGGGCAPGGWTCGLTFRDTYEFSGNLKLGYFVGRFQPYALGGLGMLIQKYYIDNPVTLAQAEQAGWQRNFDNLMSNLGVGMDFKLARNFALGARVEWQHVFGPHGPEMPLTWIYGHNQDRISAMGSLTVMF